MIFMRCSQSWEQIVDTITKCCHGGWIQSQHVESHDILYNTRRFQSKNPSMMEVTVSINVMILELLWIISYYNGVKPGLILALGGGGVLSGSSKWSRRYIGRCYKPKIRLIDSEYCMDWRGQSWIKWAGRGKKLSTPPLPISSSLEIMGSRHFISTWEQPRLPDSHSFAIKHVFQPSASHRNHHCHWRRLGKHLMYSLAYKFNLCLK